MWRMVAQSLKMRTTQVVSMALTVAISAMVILATLLLYLGIQGGIEIYEERGGADLMAIPADAASYADDADILFTGVPASIYMGADVADQIAQMDGVERVTTQFYGQTLNESCCSTTSAVRLIGVDFSTDWVVSSFAHVDLSDGLGSNRIIIGCDVGGFESGSGQILDVDYEVVDVLDRSSSELDQSIIMDIDEVRAMMAGTEGYEHFWEDYGDPDSLVSTVLIDASDDASSALASTISRATDTSVIERSDLIEQSQEITTSIFVVLGVFAVLMAVAALLQYVSRFYSLVWERKSELALYRALGASKGDLMRLIGGEAYAITAIGVIVGLVLGFVFSNLLLTLMQSGSAFPFAPLGALGQVGCILVVIVFFALVAGLSIVVPLRQVSKVDPASAMQQTDIG